jgi:hypothetical protein
LAAASEAALAAAALSASEAAAARASFTRFDADCSIHSSFPSSAFVQIKTVCWWVSLESSVVQEIVAGAVVVSDAVGVAELKADAVVSEATAWPPHAVSARRAALAMTAVFASRPETGESRLPSADWQDIPSGNRTSLRPKRVFICAPTNQIQMKVLADLSTGTRVRYRLLYSTKSVIYAIKLCQLQ